MAILAMTGGGKTVASRRILRELLNIEYPLVVLDPHGDYLGFWEKRNLFPKSNIKIFYPHLTVCEQNRDIIGYLVSKMTLGFTDPQREAFDQAMENVDIPSGKSLDVTVFIDKLLVEVDNLSSPKQPTKSVVKRQLRLVNAKMVNMAKSNEALRNKLRDFPFEPMPDPVTSPQKFVSTGQASILYLGGYDHLTQSTIVSLVLQNLFEQRASMSNIIPPFLTVVEEAHNFIPSRGEGQDETPSVEILRKIITEGRKFGTGLLLISQRPSRLDETTLSQCNTFLIFRLVNPRDQSFVEKVMENLSKADSNLLPGFGPGQGIISGQAVRFPLVVRVDYDEDLVTKSLGDEDFVTAAKNWKNSDAAKANQRGDALEQELKNAEKI
jgi:DNA helicase HerA-like ATPase